MTVLTDKPKVGGTDVALLVEELAEITLLLLLSVGTVLKKVTYID